jgi:hypothetical protein
MKPLSILKWLRLLLLSAVFQGAIRKAPAKGMAKGNANNASTPRKNRPAANIGSISKHSSSSWKNLPQK